MTFTQFSSWSTVIDERRLPCGDIPGLALTEPPRLREGVCAWDVDVDLNRDAGALLASSAAKSIR